MARMAGNTFTFLIRYLEYNRIFEVFLTTHSQYKIIVNSVPKSGTHLLMKGLELAPGIRRAPIQFGRQRIGLLPWLLITCPSVRHVLLSQYHAQKHALERAGADQIPVDSDSPFFLSVQDTVKIFRSIRPGWFAMGHLPFSEALEQIVYQEEIKMILIVRDPRDVILSHAHYLAHKRSHYMHALYKNLSQHDRIMVSMTGTAAESSHPRLLSIRERFEGILAWRKNPGTYTTYFERLIGPQGAGSREIQLFELRAILEHLGVSATDTELRSIGNSIFGGTRTFNKGKTGRWGSDFSDEHRRVCKQLVGDYLIELGYENDLDW